MALREWLVMDETTYRLGDWQVEPHTNRVRRGAIEKPLEPLAMNVLGCLLERAGELITADELLDRFWSGRNAEPSMVARCVNQIRRTIGDPARHPKYIETIRKRGYRTIASVSTMQSAGKGERARTTVFRTSPPTAILIGSSTSASQRALETAQNLRTELLRLANACHGLDLIETSETLKSIGEAAALAERFSADYIVSLHTTVHGPHQRLAVSVQSVCSSEQHDATAVVPDGLPPVDFEDLAAAVCRWARETIQEDMRRLLEPVPDTELDLWGLIAGSGPSVKGINRLKRAVSIFPHEAIAHANLATQGILGCALLGLPREVVNRDLVTRSAETAIRLAPNDPTVLSCTGYAYALMGQSELGLSLAEEAAQRLPVFRLTTVFPLTRLGRGDEAVEVLARFIGWGLPVQPEWWTAYAEALAVQRKFEEVIRISRRGLLRTKAQESTLLTHIANAQGQLGQHEEARKHWRMAQNLSPNLSIEVWERLYRRQLANSDLLEAVVGGLWEACGK